MEGEVGGRVICGAVRLFDEFDFGSQMSIGREIAIVGEPAGLVDDGPEKNKLFGEEFIIFFQPNTRFIVIMGNNSIFDMIAIPYGTTFQTSTFIF